MSRRGLGIDIGSVAVAAALVEDDGRIVWTSYSFHQGEVNATLASTLAEVSGTRFHAAASTSASHDELGLVLEQYDPVLCAIEAAELLCPERRSLFVVGGERFHLIRFHDDGSYRDTRSNTSCAAGTGSFLDQQARRLGLSGADELAGVAATNDGPVPKIASRCSVFAKTDLIHAQQEGHGIAQICDGLAAGVARNIVHTVVGVAKPPQPAYIVGGVSLNSRVVRHLSSQVDSDVRIPRHASVFGAIGAAKLAVQEKDGDRLVHQASLDLQRLIESMRRPNHSRKYEHEPLDKGAVSCRQPDAGISKPELYLFTGERAALRNPVETEIFDPGTGEKRRDVHLGVDIGSTSTKAVLTAADGSVVAGFYTRTAGKPIEAIQALMEAVSDAERKLDCVFNVLAAGTTGSGRKLVGTVLGADLILDEITAHARAAVEIEPDVDTIIEIGGQDAKFTTLRRGIVTFSHMNTVCAAGTGSFIEEQAAKLGVDLTDVAGRACRARAPRTSDRCTVFMERDINHLLTHGYDVDEILAAVLHSVVENYLHKVATPSLIGNKICFQGATARNESLVSAFRRKLGKPVLVSKYCHLTGALGAALTAGEEQSKGRSGFKGIGIWQEDIPVRLEVCDLCGNACKLRIARVGGEDVAFGLSCGRDYGSGRPASRSPACPDVIEERREKYKREAAAVPPLPEKRRNLTFGIPKGLYMIDDAELWKRFFSELGVSVVVSGPKAGRDGRRLAGAEFCAPIADLHGHVRSMLRRADYVFLPHYLCNANDSSEGDCIGYSAGDMCYYSQYAPTIVRSALEDSERIISPLMKGPHGMRAAKRELTEVLAPILKAEHHEIRDAYDRAVRFDQGVRRSAILSRTRRRSGKDIEVVLVGRPYTIFSSRLNKGIPGLVSALGVHVSVQDEFSEDELQCSDAYHPEELTDSPWAYASRALEVARYAAVTEGVYPVFITSFRCSPDAFIIDAFKEILDRAGKPYLVLQVDDLDSAVGYETRIEAGVRAFRNHLRRTDREALDFHDDGRKPRAVCKQDASPSLVRFDWTPVKSLWGQLHALREKTLLVPCWDPYVCELLVEMFRNRDVDARLLRETPDLIVRGMRHNSGQCVPVNVVAEECMDYVRREELDPSKTALWVPKARWACNIPMYPSFIRRILRAEGFGDLDVYRGVVTFSDIDPTAPVEAYFAYLFGGLLRRFGCMIRPYEDEAGSTDAAISECLSVFRGAFRSRLSKEDALQQATHILDGVARTVTPRPKVGVFGDFYVRDNDVFNQGLIRTIEQAGGEVVTTPYSEYAEIVSSAHFKRLLLQGRVGEWTMLKALLAFMQAIERRYRRRLGEPYNEAASFGDENMEEALSRFWMRIEQSGESFENVLKVLHLRRCHPDIALFVQVNPVFCCPALVTEAISVRIERVTGIPIVSITYDGTSTLRNHVVEPYLKYAARDVRKAVG